MRRHQATTGIAILLSAACVCGCGKSKVEEGELALPAWLTEEEPATDAEAITLAAATSSAVTAPDEPPGARASQEFSLTPGQRFSVRRVVEQELEQASLNGVPQISRSRVELVLAFTVKDAQPDRQRLGVRYDQVMYTHDIFGESVEYDSRNPPEVIPFAALAYHALGNEEFEFERTRDPYSAEGVVTNVIGYQEFVERCLQRVPADQRDPVRLELETTSGEKLIGELYHHATGLIGEGSERTLGDSWGHQSQMFRPFPMQVDTHYTLQALSDDVADILISGTITPLTPLGEAPGGEQEVRIAVESGHTEGRCTVDRVSGLPRESRVVRTIDMRVQTGGVEFTQQKRTVTTIESSPATVAPPDTPAAETSATRFQ